LRNTKEPKVKMKKDIIKILIKSFNRIPKLSAHTIDSFDITQLSGYTNLNFQLKNAQNDWILRIPQKKTNAYINRTQEAYNTIIAFNLGLAPKCLWRDNSGYSLSDTIKQSRSLSVADLHNPSRLSQLVGSLKKLHQSDQVFQGTVDITELLSRFYELMPKSKQRFFANTYKGVAEKVEVVLKQVEKHVPSHNDLILENILLDRQSDPKKIWIIDWEYATMASPYWDLATLCNEGKLTVFQAENLLNLYQGKEQSLNIKVLNVYRNILSTLSIFWLTAFAG
jgi:thiamine kinase-like enzyme